ncbi:MAG TPA: hypothetical protein V6C89_20245 [Drouetiella sp.]|jgi:hypothetical protein
MTSKMLALAVLVATSVGTTQLASQSAPATKTKSAAPSIAKLQVELDTTGIAKSTKVEIVPKDPYGPDDVISLSGAPMHVRILFDGKKLQYGDNDFMQPHLLIYPLADFAAVFPKGKRAEFNKQIATLRKIIANKSSKGFDEIPVLPQSDGAQFCHLQEKFLTFNNNKGTGVSFVTAYGNGDPPLNEPDFIYAFQGITADSKYYVAFYWPVKAIGLPKDLPLPKSNQYCQKLARAKYEPSLDALDRAVSSITLK